MRKVIYFGILRRWDARRQMEDWQRLPQEERLNLEKVYPALPRPDASFMLFATAMIALAGWPTLTIAKVIELAMLD